jgi:cytochrome c-type biogenesis protein CcmF
VLSALALHRRSYGGLAIHLGFGCMAVGIAGSSLGSRETEVSMAHGQMVQWAGRDVRYVELIERDLRQKVVVEARLEFTEPGGRQFELLPAQNLYRPQNQWGTQVAIDSTLARDVYVIMHGGRATDKIHLTLIDHPLMRWLWIGGWIGLAGVLIAAWPERARRDLPRGRGPVHEVIPRPHLAAFLGKVRHE